MENKEREAFEAEFSKIKSDITFWLHTWDEEMQGYNHPVMCWFWYMWQAKKQATPEGFVLVPKNKADDSERMDFLADRNQSIANVVLPSEIVERNLSSLRDAIDEARIIEAQEQGRD